MPRLLTCALLPLTALLLTLPALAQSYSEGVYVRFDPDAGAEATLSVSEDMSSDSMDFTSEVVLANPLTGEACRGFLPSSPNVVVVAEELPVLSIAATVDMDGVMVVRQPDGSWLCSDDANGLDPGVQIDSPSAGPYHVWVGSYSQADHAEVTLTASASELVTSENPVLGGSASVYPEGESPMTDSVSETAFSEANYAGSELHNDAAEVRAYWQASGAPLRARIQARGTLPNPVEGEMCRGNVGVQPSASVQVVGEPDGPIVISAVEDAGGDLVMVVQTPSGAWYCSDDGFGLNPAIQVSSPESGRYNVWAGTYGTYNEDGTPTNARLIVRKSL